MKNNFPEDIEKTVVAGSQGSKKSPNTPILFSKNSSNSLLDRYNILKVYGEDSLEIIKLAEDTFLRREVILKTFQKRESLSKTEKFGFMRFVTEAKVTALLEHPNILPLYDKQELPGKLFYFTLRKINGKTLHEILLDMKAGEEEFDPNWLLTIFLKICDAISYAHSQGYLHQNLSSENILVGEYGEVYVTDWGFAGKIGKVNKEQIQWFQENTKLSVHIAPEQKENGNRAKIQSDIYALGQLLDQCFLIDADVEAIIVKAIQTQWSKRYLSVQEMITDIENYSKNLRVSVREYNPFELTIKWMARNKKAIFSALFGILVFALIFLISSLKNKEEQEKEYQKYFNQAKESQKKLEQESTFTNNKIELFFSTRDQLENALKASRLLEPSEKRLDTLYQIGEDLAIEACALNNYSFAKSIPQLFKEEKKEQHLLISQIEKKQQENKEKEKINQELLLSNYSILEKELQKKSKSLRENTRKNKFIATFGTLLKSEENLRKKIDKKLQELHRNKLLEEGEDFYSLLVESLTETKLPSAIKRINSIFENLQETIKYPSLEERPSEIKFLYTLVNILNLEYENYGKIDILLKGRLQIMLKKYAEAVTSFKNAQKTIEMSAEKKLLYLALLGQSYANFELSNVDEARKNWNDIEKIENKDVFDPSWNKFVAYAYYQYGKDLYGLEKYEKALQYCEKAKQLDVFLIEAYRISGICKRVLYWKNKEDLQKAEALEDLNIVIRYSPIAENYYERGLIKQYLYGGLQAEEAEEDYKNYIIKTKDNTVKEIKDKRNQIFMWFPELKTYK